MLLLVVAPALLGAGLYAAQGPDLTSATSFRVTSAEGPGRLVDLAWTAAPGAASYAVVVDQAPPRPGSLVRPGPRILTLAGRSLRVELGPASTGSPSARTVHQVAILPLDGDGRRMGEDVAWLRVRTGT
jgi:hypothetical protein